MKGISKVIPFFSLTRRRGGISAISVVCLPFKWISSTF